MNKIFLCACKRGTKVDNTKLQNFTSELDSKDIAYTLFDDLCGSLTKPDFKFPDNENDKFIIHGCQPKAMKNLLANSGVLLSNNNIDFKILNETNLNEISFDDLRKGNRTHIKYDKDWKPWYPVLDYDLCTSCQKCLNFCLFGVYTLNDEGKVMVENPENCKDLCPACARTCPTNAIVFPKHHESPIDGGKGEFSISTDNMLEDIQNNKDVYKVLANRRKASGVSLFKADQLQIAKQERDDCNCKK